MFVEIAFDDDGDEDDDDDDGGNEDNDDDDDDYSFFWPKYIRRLRRVAIEVAAIGLARSIPPCTSRFAGNTGRRPSYVR